MEKIAYLVNFAITTRVVVDDDADDRDIARTAIEKLTTAMVEDGIGSYLCIDNLGEIEEDTECPYGTFEEDFGN